MVLILLMCVLTVILPIFIRGHNSGGDLGTHLNLSQAIRAAIASGNLFPGWTNDNLGFGSIGIRFYPPITSYASALIEVLTGSWHYAFWINLLGWMALGCSGVYLFVKEWGTPVRGVFAGMLYSIVPYHLAEINKFFLYGEFAASAILPFCFLFTTRICRQRSWIDVAPFAALYSLLILTHIPTAIIATLCLFIYAAILIEWRHLRKTLLLLLTSGVLVMLATGFFWVRVVMELQWVVHADLKYSTGAYYFGQFLFPASLYKWNSLPGYLSLYRHLDAMTVLTMLLLVPFFAVLITKSKRADGIAARVGAAITGTGLFALLMLSKPSTLIWSSFNLLQRIQFPWRWLGVLSMLGVVSFALSVPRLVKGSRILERAIAYSAVCLIVMMLAYDVRQIAVSRRIARTEFNTLANDVQSKATSEVWWPVWAKKGALEAREPVIAENRSVEITDWTSEERKFTVGEGIATNLRVATFYYPYWRATVNGRTVEVDKDENGAIILPINEERSEVDLHFEEPFFNVVARWLSVGTWILMLSVIFCSFVRIVRRSEKQKTQRNRFKCFAAF